MNESMNQAYGRLETVYQEAVTLLTTYGLDVLGAIAILIIGLWVAGRTEKFVRGMLARSSRVDATLITFFASMAKYMVLIVVGMAVLDQFGVETTSLVAVLGAAGLAIGLALQGTLSNVAAGVMLLIFRPYKIGDYVEAGGQAGTIKELNLFFTVMATPDNVRIIVPNSQIWGSTLKNYSANDTRRIDLVVGISYGDDIDQAMGVAEGVVAGEERILKDPEPMIKVTNLGESSVDILVRFWVASADYWGVKFDMTKAVKQAFDKNGVNIPFPCRTIYIQKEEG